jgi:CBS domain-containing protein
MKTVPISSIMTREVVSVAPTQKLVDIKHIYQKRDFHHHIPVVRDDRLVGMVSLVDFMYRIKGAGLDDNESVYQSVLVEEIMTPNPYTVPSSATVAEVADVLAKGRYRAIPVVDNDCLVGIVSTADMIKFLLTR